jgi:3-dehydroquinate dehydratase-1
MNTFELDNVKSEKRMPAICIPVTGNTAEALKKEIDHIKNLPHQLVEWRADYLMASIENRSFWHMIREVLRVLGILKAELQVPILFTIRTAREGGEADIEEADYYFLNRMVAESGMADLIDIEALAGDAEMVKEFVEHAHKNGCGVVLSNHDFEKTPPVEKMVEKYQSMMELGGDITKLAVMPETEEDVAELLQAAAVVNEEYPDRNLVAISMGELGMVSRICAGQMGSVITFAAGKEASAPGQIDAVILQGYLEKYYK